MNFFRNLLPKQDLFKLFAVTAFPIHFWAYIAWLRDFQVIAKRTDVWDALGVGTYTSVLAFFESVVIFLGIYLLFVLVLLALRALSPAESKPSGSLDLEVVVPQVSAGILSLSLVAIIDRFWRIYSLPLEESVWNIVMLFLLIVLILLSTVLIARKDKVRGAVMWFVNAVVVLTSLYLFLDFVSLVVVIIRQFWKPV